jgi:DNA (cytosine-5)-methyltransferase 1
MVNGKPTVISLFSGCGGSSLGYKWAGFREILAIDFDRLAVETFRLNFPDVPCWERDIRTVTGKQIMESCGIKRRGLDLLDASPPCQGFSTAGRRSVNDSRNDLFREFARLVRELEPKTFVMENVSGLIKGRMKGRFIEIMGELRALSYQVKCKLMNARWYGVPQSRQRLIWIGTRADLGKQPVFPEPTKEIVTVRQAIGDLPIGEPGNHQPQVVEAWHKSRPGQALRGACHYVGSFQSRRLDPRDASPTLVKAHRHWHYAVPRQLNDLEMKRICTFPDDFILAGSKCERGHQLGNAVMPKFMEAIARTVKEGILDHAPIS